MTVSKSKQLGQKGFSNLTDDELEYVQSMDGAEYGEFKREKMRTSGIGAMLDRFEKVSRERKK